MNSGEVVVGRIGDDLREEAFATGDFSSVNDRLLADAPAVLAAGLRHR